MKKQKVMAMALAVAVMGGAVAGCAKEPQNPVTGNNSEQNPSVSEKASGEKELTPVTFKMFIADTVMQKRWEGDNMTSPISKKIQEDTGVTLDIEFPVGDIKQRISLMVASGEYPDLLYAGPETNAVVDAGGFIKLDQLIEEHGPNLQALYGEFMGRLKYSAEDPSIYYLGRDGVRDEKTAPTGGIQIMHAAVKEAGFPEIKTLADVENVIKQYVQKYPTLNDGPTIGFSIIGGDTLHAIFTLFNAAGNVAGLPNDGDWAIDQNTYEAKYKYQLPEVKEYLKWLNHLNNTGLLDPESFTQKNDQFQAKVAAGRIVAMGNDTWHYAASSRAARQTYGNEFGYGVYPVTVHDNVKSANFMSAGYPAVAGVGITTAAKDPTRAIQFLDYLASEEVQVLTHWGLEGEHYSLENGQRVISDETWNKRFNDQEWSNQQGFGSWGYPWPTRGKGEKDASGQLFDPVTPEISARNYTEPEKEILSHYNAKLWKDLYPTEQDFKTRPYGAAAEFSIPKDSELTLLQNKLGEITFKRIAQMILADPAEFDGIYEAYIKELQQNGLEKMESEFNKFLEARIQLLNE